MEQRDHKSGGFTYTYSAREQAEVKRIREKYAPPTEAEDKLARLRRLDAGVTNAAQAVSIAFGVIGTLLFGLGMSIPMTELGALISESRVISILIGCLIGTVGATLAALAYPVYNAIVKVKRRRLAPEIIRLTDELLK